MGQTLEEMLEIMEEDNPKAMVIITEYKEILEQEDEEYFHLLVDKLKNAKITWDLPIYQQAGGVTMPSPKRCCLDSSKSYDKGRIRKDEAILIQRNWSNMVKKYELPDKPICFARWRNKSLNRSTCPMERVRLFVTTHLARHLKRNLYQVYQHFVNTHAYFKKGLYNDFEQKVINICLNFMPDKACVIIPYVLNRPPRQLYIKIDRIKGKLPEQSEKRKIDPNKPMQKWDLHNGGEFLKLLLKYTMCTEVKELKNRVINKDVWINIKNELNLNIPSLRSYWFGTLHQQLFIKKDFKLRKLRNKICSLLRAKLDTLKVWKDIDWTELIKELPEGLTSDFVYQLVYRPMRYNKNIQEMPLADILNYVDEKIANSRKYRNKKIRRLIWTENEELIYVSDVCQKMDVE